MTWSSSLLIAYHTGLMTKPLVGMCPSSEAISNSFLSPPQTLNAQWRRAFAPPPLPRPAQLGLAVKLEKHELIEFRRLAAQLYKQNGKWRRAVELAQADGLFRDAMETTAASGDAELAEELVRCGALAEREGLSHSVGTWLKMVTFARQLQGSWAAVCKVHHRNT